MMGLRVGRDGILRPLIVRSALSFWNGHDADLWINQRVLVMHVRASLVGVDKDTVRDVLDEMSHAGMLVRRCPTEKRTVYRVAARFADPTAPGYAREVDELLIDPMPWVSGAGDFYRVGSPEGRPPRIHPVASFPHYFAKHAWMRSWIRALASGAFADPVNALREAAAEARAASVEVLWLFWAHRERNDGIGAAGRAFEGTRLFRAGPPRNGAAWAVSAGERAEEALRILHDMCGHEHLRWLLGPSLLRGPPVALSERIVYQGLDTVLAHRVSDPSRPISIEDVLAQTAQPEGPIAMPHAEPDPLLASLEPRVRAMEPRLRATLVDHRRAWPASVLSPYRGL